MDERSVYPEFRSTLAIPRHSGILPGKSGDRRSNGSRGASRLSRDDWRIHLPPADRGNFAVVYAGIALFGDWRRVQLSGHHEADVALAILPLNLIRKSGGATILLRRRFLLMRYCGVPRLPASYS